MKTLGILSISAVTCDGEVPSYSSGTSCSTATFAGMAALVWANMGAGQTH